MPTGKSPATAKQKAIAKKTINKTKPWKRSTGPRSKRGKAIARLNACSKTSKKIVLESWQFSTSQEFEEECQKAERLIQEITESISNYREYTTTSIETFVEEGIVATFIFKVKY